MKIIVQRCVSCQRLSCWESIMHYAPCPYCGRTTFLRVASVDPDQPPTIQRANHAGDDARS